MTDQPFARRMFNRMNQAYQDETERRKRIKKGVLPGLENAVRGNAEAMAALKQIVEFMDDQHQAIAAATGHLAEEFEGDKALDELAHLTTFLNAMDVYFAAEPATVQGALEKFELTVLQKVLVDLPSQARFNELFEVFQRAKTLRYKKAKDGVKE